MKFRILWRSTVFIITILLIYLAFPILIVPSSLPAIKAIVVDSAPPSSSLDATAYLIDEDTGEALPIQQLEIPRLLTPKEKVQAIMQIHQQGINLIFPQE